VVKRLSVREARARFADTIDSVDESGEPVVIERRGRPVVALIPAAQLDAVPPVSDPAIDAEIDALVAEYPALRTVIEVSRRNRGRLRPPRPWKETLALAREEYVAEKVRKKGLAPNRASP